MCNFKENFHKPNPVMDGAILAISVSTVFTLFAQKLLPPLFSLEA
jgi:hypothetical protein